MTFKKSAVMVVILTTAVTSLLLASCTGESSIEGSKGWQCIAQPGQGRLWEDYPEDGFSARAYRWNAPDKETAAAKAMAQCSRYNRTVSSCVVDLDECRPI